MNVPKYVVVTAGAMACVATSVLGQAFNIDCGGHLGQPPSSTYGAGANQPGYWNAAGIPAELRDLQGNQTPARLDGNASAAIHDIPHSSGDDERLMETFFVTAASNSLLISNLVAGPYDLYAYSWGGQIFGDRTVGFGVHNGVDTFGGSLTFGPVWPGQQVEGETYARIPVEVLEGFNFLQISVGGGGSKTFNVLAGIQLVPIPAPGSVAVVMGAGVLAVRRRRPFEQCRGSDRLMPV